MPLHVYSADAAVAIRKDNSLSSWGGRSEINRVEPIAKPGFDAPFKLEPGDSIFTMGSCFARNIENHLITRGYRVPMRELFKTPLFSAMAPDTINNYGVPSLANELSWALDPETPFPYDDHILEVMTGRYADLHLSPTLRPQPKETVHELRKLLIEATQTVRNCRIVIMTLGLAEVWFDKQTGTYINEAVRPAFIRSYPGRFELHVLSFDEVLSYMRRVLDLLRLYGQPETRVILTVSPVPLNATHRPMDVIVANTYSKSVLRCVIDAVMTEYSFVTYYPSYESVMLSDRRLTWLDDFRHVSEALIGVNVSRMLSAFSRAADDLSTAKAEIEAGGAVAAAAWAEKVVTMSEEDAEAFFRDFGQWAQQSSDFALKYATYAKERGDQARAMEIVRGAPQMTEPLAALGGECALAVQQPNVAIEILNKVIKLGLRSHPLWRHYVSAHLQLHGIEQGIAIAQDYINSTSGHEATTFYHLAICSRRLRRRLLHPTFGRRTNLVERT
ncbi:GSCFA domain-containing protein [Reyranella soli]|uniref:GSCFA domain-containing protein n=1 Tax=Reyranella soli TaxID=1230389 RepID=A0A512NSW2_9HYPH|nr:GSCFA domain-containing protein [Reyranella soli]GEP62029.1 hypothetical protein RSO01_91950 [Reyranella soli]